MEHLLGRKRRRRVKEIHPEPTPLVEPPGDKRYPAIVLKEELFQNGFGNVGELCAGLADAFLNRSLDLLEKLFIKASKKIGKAAQGGIPFRHCPKGQGLIVVATGP